MAVANAGLTGPSPLVGGLVRERQAVKVRTSSSAGRLLYESRQLLLKPPDPGYHVRFRGLVVFKFRRELPGELVNGLGKFVDEVNNTLLVKGSTDASNASRILEYSAEGDSLRLVVESGRQVKIHNAALRLRNHIEREWGRRFKIGVKSLSIEDLSLELEGEYRVSLALPYVKDIRVSNGRTVVTFGRLEERELKKPVLDRLLKLLEDKEARARWGGKAEHWYLLDKSLERTPLYTDDPNKVLIEAGWIKRFSTGQWVYTPVFTAFLKAMTQLFIEEVVRPLGFKEAVLPKVYPLDVGLRTGHLKGTINSIVFACFPRSYDIREFEDLVDLMVVTEGVDRSLLLEKLEKPGGFLCFAQCEPFYQFFFKEIVDDSCLPVKWYDASGPSYRWEAGGLYGVERLVEFHRVEVVWLGTKEQVVEIRDELLGAYRRFMNESLELEWRMAWVTPFYLEQAGEVGEVASLDVNQPGTIDFEVWLPFKGGRESKRSWLEVGNISIHGTKFVKPFRIKHKKGEVVWTGCSGFGSERWLLAFLAQKGFDPSNWPRRFKESLRGVGVPKPVLTVTYPEHEHGRRLSMEIASKLREHGLLED